MAICGEETDFLKYTRAWTEEVNRGGLFEVNDNAYVLFKEIELNLQNNLQTHLQPTMVAIRPRQHERETCFICNTCTKQKYTTSLAKPLC